MSLLEVTGLNTYYGDSHILFDVALRVVSRPPRSASHPCEST